MLSNKSLALALCLTMTGCAQTPQNDADGGHWWSFGGDKAASKDAPAADAAQAPVNAKAAANTAKADVAKSETGSSWWPFSSKDSAPADAKGATAPAAAPATVAKSETESRWWWPFESKPKPLNKVDVTNIPMPDPKVTQAWLDDYEPRLRIAIKDTNLQLERRDNVLVVIVPVDGAYNPKRPAMLLPVTLGPFTRVAKAVEGDPKTAVLVLGHVDTTAGAAPQSQVLTKERAQSIASIFSLSGLKQDRLMLRGMGDMMPRAANDSVQGRALNRRMEIMLTQRTTMLALLSKYNQPTPPKVEMVAVQDVAPAAAAANKAVAAKKAPVKKAAAKVAAKKPAAKPAAKKAAAPAKKTASNDQPKN